MKKVKKALFYKLYIGVVPFVVLGIPFFAQASVLTAFTSLFQHSADEVSAESSGLNSQTMPLLEPAVNIDPHPAKGGGDITVVDGTSLLSESGPSGSEADTGSWPTASQISVYTVRTGDTLASIAKMFGVSVNTIVWANNLPQGKIAPGDTLVILPITGLKHTVAKGETLESIAKKFKGDITDIAQYNGLSGDVSLVVGEDIIIPDGEITTPPPPPPANSHATKIRNIAKGKTIERYLGGGGPDIPNYFAWPLQGDWPITQGLHGWNAVDIGAPKGTPIVASAGGVVIVSKFNGGWNGGYGNYVVIQHPNGTQTLYAHASSVLVSAGDQVAQGQVIAKVGMTGESTGPHVHFEVRGAANPFGK